LGKNKYNPHKVGLQKSFEITSPLSWGGQIDCRRKLDTVKAETKDQGEKYKNIKTDAGL